MRWPRSRAPRSPVASGPCADRRSGHGLHAGFGAAPPRARRRSLVAELVSAVVEWNRGPVGEHAGHPLRDERVTVHEVDVAIMLKAESRSFDAILLDVDNGPDGLTQEGNDWLYSRVGLNASYEALRPKGVLAVWSTGPDRAFSKRLRKAGFEVDEGPGSRARRERCSPPHLDRSNTGAIEPQRRARVERYGDRCDPPAGRGR